MSAPRGNGLESHLRLRRDSGGKLLVCYVTAGYDGEWLDSVRAVAEAGADAIEIGIPFSDPMIDGPVVQQASLRALERSTTPASAIAALADADAGVPLVVMTYYNPIARAGEQRFAHWLSESGVAGAIVPDLPLEESVSWRKEAADAHVDTVLLVAPSTPEERSRRICAASRGFVYAVGVMGVTGERESLAKSSAEIGSRLQQMTDLPICIGVGVSNAEQAAQACEFADGVVVGSALMRRLLEGAGPEGAGAFVRELREGVDSARNAATATPPMWSQTDTTRTLG